MMVAAALPSLAVNARVKTRTNRTSIPRVATDFQLRFIEWGKVGWDIGIVSGEWSRLRRQSRLDGKVL